MKINWQQRRWLLVLPVLGIVILVALASGKKPPQKHSNGVDALLVETAEVKNTLIEPYVTGFGRVRPKERWQALSEVSGRVIYRHPKLEKGKALSAGTVLLKIDPIDYELKLAQARSDLNSAEAELSRTQLNDEKLALSLRLEEQRLSVLQKELKRKQGLLKSGSVSASTVDSEQANVWAQEQKVLDVKNAVDQHPDNMAVAQAKVKLAQARLSEAERKLAKTTITLPFDARIANVNVEMQQVVAERESLVTAHRTDLMEIPVQVALSDMRHFGQYLSPQLIKGEFPDVQTWDLDAEASLYIGNKQYRWQGKLTSVGESIDPEGNTVTLIVDVAFDYKAFEPGKRPPLISDMYVQVKVKGAPRPLLSVPSDALHGSRLYLLEDGKLAIRHVEVAFESNGRTVIRSGVREGEVIVVSDVIPAVPGRALRTQNQVSEEQTL
ncbi:HlyD family secretion protein [Pseudoalteromonas rubra]|uniref:HlyD family secretion protein n=1 Tax=Pseudoalteromonas rubra TaxID=43658 RepID=A0A5S3WVP8_9GAMM|nr:HlyD family secretion protein [Pseudoalteromonas rubra]TMP31836.1 HlyD family secretion protein [Pseudoalteromonas rubra]TMP33081.1 HlyD family secretion protein [Pseudoalteromonas rubra]